MTWTHRNVLSLLLPDPDLDPRQSLFSGANRWSTILWISVTVLPNSGQTFFPWLFLRNDVISSCELMVDGWQKNDRECWMAGDRVGVDVTRSVGSRH